MRYRNQPPIFCDHCAALAFATLDDAPLCAECLQKKLAKGLHMVKKIEPLSFMNGSSFPPRTASQSRT